MRVLIYTQTFAPAVGGLETYVRLLADGLARSGVEVTLVTQTPRGNHDDASASFEVVRQPSLLRLLFLLRGADVVHLGGPVFLPLLASLSLRRKTIIEHHAYQACCPNGLLLELPQGAACPGHFMAGRYDHCVRCNAVERGWRGALAHVLKSFPRRWLAGRVARNVGVSWHTARRNGLPRSRAIRHGVPLAPALPSRSAGAAVFGFVGRLVAEKGLATLVRAAANLRRRGYRFTLRIIGDGPLRGELESRARAEGLGTEVEFSGFVVGAELEKCCADLTAVVMPSIWEETAGLAAVEQMMRGRVVVAADIGGLGEYVGDAGLKFSPGDADALAACLARLIDEPDLSRALGEKARARALAHFGEERMVADHLALYREVMGVGDSDATTGIA